MNYKKTQTTKLNTKIRHEQRRVLKRNRNHQKTEAKHQIEIQELAEEYND